MTSDMAERTLLITTLYATRQQTHILNRAQGGTLRKMPLDMLLSEDVAVAARCAEAFLAVRRLEEGRAMNMALYNQAVLQQRPQVRAQAMSRRGRAWGAWGCMHVHGTAALVLQLWVGVLIHAEVCLGCDCS